MGIYKYNLSAYEKYKKAHVKVYDSATGERNSDGSPQTVKKVEAYPEPILRALFAAHECIASRLDKIEKLLEWDNTNE